MATVKKEIVKMAGAAKPAVASRKDGLFQRMARYLHEVRVELRKTTWPSKQDVINSTKVVLGVVVAVGIYLALLDAILSLFTARIFQ